MTRTHSGRRLARAREQLRTAVPLVALARAQLASATSPRGVAYRPGVDPRQSPEVREHVRSIDETIRAQIDTLNGYLAEQTRARALAEQVADGDPDAVIAVCAVPVEGGVIRLGDWAIPTVLDPTMPPGMIHFRHRDRPPILIDDPDPHGLAEHPIEPYARCTITPVADDEQPPVPRGGTPPGAIADETHRLPSPAE